MNKTNLELIRNHIVAVRKIIKEDPDGIIFHESNLNSLDKQVVSELQQIYESMKEKEES